jgi:predicted SprT family Zn-dependent metalloprotease
MNNLNNITTHIRTENDQDLELLKYLTDNYDELFGVSDSIKETAKEHSNNNIQHVVLASQYEEGFDVYEYFALYNQLYFEDKLGCVQLEWSKKMTLCAGVFQVRQNIAVIRLSEPLLKFRSVNEIKETLLHEMIHAWVYVMDLDMSDDKSGHGKNFKVKMNEINKNTGLNITVFHSFHDEVEFYRKHVWKCDGPCQKKSPYFGLVKRAVNRPPGKSDMWWADHEKNCGGKFTKISEPEKETEKPNEKKKENKVKGKKNNKRSQSTNKTLDNFVKTKENK